MRVDGGCGGSQEGTSARTASFVGAPAPLSSTSMFTARLAPRIRGVAARLASRAISTATVHPAVADVRQLALPIAFLSVQGWEGEDGLECAVSLAAQVHQS